MIAEDFGRFRDSFSGSVTGEVLTFNPDAIPEPDTLAIRMTRGERRIANELRKGFGGFRRVIIDVDGERHEFSADSLIQMLEDYEDAQGMNNHMKLFGTPEKAARTIMGKQLTYDLLDQCDECPHQTDECFEPSGKCAMQSYDALLEWLRGDAE